MSEPETSAPRYGAVVTALERLRDDGVAAMEFLVLREVIAWVFSEQNPGGDYDRSHASMLGGALFAGVDDAPDTAMSGEPEATEATEAMLLARRRFVEGAHELAALGDVGVDVIVEQRIVPAMTGELERWAGDTESQVRWTYVYLLYALAMGERHDQDLEVMQGIAEIFDGWMLLLTSGEESER